MNSPRLVSFALTLVCGVSFLTGCADSRQGPSAGEGRRPPPQPSLAGDAAFFANAVEVHVSLDGASFLGGPEGGPRRGGGGAPRGGPPRMNATTDEMVNMGPGVGGGGETGMGSRGGGGMGRGGGGGFDGPHDSAPPDSDGEGPRGGRVDQPGFSPVRQIIRVVFTNHGQSTADLTVVEVKSLLGDFAPRPEHFALAAGQSAPLNEMRSSVAENVEELDLTITLRRGTERETKVVRLAGVTAPTAPPPPPRPPQ